MTSREMQRNAHWQLNLEKLEHRNMLCGISPLECCDNLQAPDVVTPDVSSSPLRLESQFFSDFFRRTPFRFLRPFVNLPTTEELGQLDDEVTVAGTNSFFDRIDRYEFEVDQAGQLNATLEFENNTRSGLLVFDADRQLVARSFTRGDSIASLSTDLESGNYVAIVVRGFGYYELNLDFDVETTEAPDSGPVIPDTTLPESGQPNDNGSTPIDQSPIDQSPIDQSPISEPATPPAVPEPTVPTELQDVPYYGSGYDWNLNAVGAPEAWNAGYTGDGVVVAVIDTGVNVSHGDLNDNIWTNSGEIAGDGIDNDRNGFVDDYYGWNFVSNSANINDDNGHGTHVAGTIAAEQNGTGATGVAPDARILPVKVLNSQGSGFVSSIANGIRYAVNNGADIINLSLGGGFSSAIASAIGYAAANDVLVVAAAGNESASVPSNPATLSNSYSNLLSVGAYDFKGNIAGFSNEVGRSGAVQVDAPGVNILSTAANGRYTYLSGTSMATPHVAGIAALTLSASPNLTAASLRNVIVTSSSQSARGSDAQGTVNAVTAIPQAINSSLNGLTTVGRPTSGSQQGPLSLARLNTGGNPAGAVALQITNVATDLTATAEIASVEGVTHEVSLTSPVELAGAIDDLFSNDDWQDEVVDFSGSETAPQLTDLAISEFDLNLEVELAG